MIRSFFALILFLSPVSSAQISVIKERFSAYTQKNQTYSHIIAFGKEIQAFILKHQTNPLPTPEKDPEKRAVLLIHGLNSSPKDWHMLIKDLKNEGFEVYTIYLNYWKKGGYLESCEKIQNLIDEILQTHEHLDIVGHSLGGVAAINAVNQMGEIQEKIEKLITINSPLNGTKALNGFTRLFLPDELIGILTYKGEFTNQLQEKSKETKKLGIRFFHTATESDHLVQDLATNFLQDFEEAIIVTGLGHLSTINSFEVRQKIIEWLKLPSYKKRKLSLSD